MGLFRKYNRIEKISIAIVVLIVVGPLIYTQVFPSTFKADILKNPIVIKGKIERFKRGYKTLDSFDFTFVYNGSVYKTHSSSEGRQSDYSNLSKHVIGKEFPVVINPKDPGKYSIILMFLKILRHMDCHSLTA